MSERNRYSQRTQTNDDHQIPIDGDDGNICAILENDIQIAPTSHPNRLQSRTYEPASYQPNDESYGIIFNDALTQQAQDSTNLNNYYMTPRRENTEVNYVRNSYSSDVTD